MMGISLPASWRGKTYPGCNRENYLINTCVTVFSYNSDSDKLARAGAHENISLRTDLII